jgi:hypothetical protein
MTNDQLTAILAERAMGWSVGPDRFTIGGRRWLPRWRFQPAERLDDAFRLLEQTAPQEYSMGSAEKGGFWVKVRVVDSIGEASETSKPRAITFAVARALELEVDSSE